MDAIDRFGEALVEAGHRRRRWPLRAMSHSGPRHIRGLGHSLSRARVAIVALPLALTTTAITLAATGVLLTGSPVRPVSRPIATAGDGIPIEGGSRLLPLRVADPAGGLPWGMRIVHTTRGLICVQIGRVYHGQLGDLGIDGAFANDGRFHPLPADALPDVLGSLQGLMSGNCAAPEEIYAGNIVGLELNAASNPPAPAGVAADRREISFGLLGPHAVSITYHSGSETHTQPVLPGLGAYLIVQRYVSGRQLGSISETDGSDQPYPYGGPASPNGALSAITYRYAGKLCTDTGRGRILHSCGLSESPPPTPATLPVIHEPLRVHLQIHSRLITSVDVAFRTPYAITNATQRYDASVFAGGCHEIGGRLGDDHNLARGAAVSISTPIFSSDSCSRVLTIEVSYDRFLDNNIQHTIVGTTTIREPPGTHTLPLPRRR
jgi:hypothetical protein